MAKNEAKIKFTAETGEFNKQIKSADSSLNQFRSELKLNATQMKNTGESTQLLKERQSILQNELEASKTKTEALSNKVEAAKRIYGENAEEVKKLQTQLNNAKNVEQAFQNEIQQTTEKLDKQKISLEKVSEAAGKVGDKLTNAGQKMSVVSAGIVAAGTASISAFNEVDDGADNVVKATGATGEAAQGLAETYEKVASSVVGDFGEIGSMVGEVNTRFGYTGKELETASVKFQKFSDITGVDTTEAVQSVSRALNDAGIPLDEYDTLLDQLAKAGQSAGIDVTKLANSLSENGSIMRSMGFDTEETIALLSQFELSGANTSVMLTGMKKAMTNWADEGKNGNTEFAKLVEGIKGGSVSASDAIDVFGTKAGPMLVDAIKSGKFEYQDMLKTIQNSKGTVEGTFDETVDGGYKLELAMQNAKMAAAEVGDTLSTSLVPIIETVTIKIQDFASWWENLDSSQQNVIMTIAGVVAAIGPVLIVMGSIASAISKITNVINIMKNSTLLATIATKAQAVAQGILNAVMNANPITLVIVAIVALVAIFVVLWNKCEGFRNFFINLWEGIKNLLSTFASWVNTNVIQPVSNFFTGLWENCKEYVFTAFEWIKDKVSTAINKVKSVITTVMNGIKTVFTTVWNAVKNTVTTVWNGIVNFITPIVNKIKTTITTAWNAVKSAISKVLNAIKSVVTSVWNSVKSAVTTTVNAIKTKVTSVFNAVKSTVTSIFNGIKSTATRVWNGVKNAIIKPIETAKNKVKGIVDTIKGFFTGMKLSLPKIKLPHFKITGELSISPPSVPKLSIDWYKNGGIMTRPTIFGFNGSSIMAGGEAGDEAILPIDRLKDYIADTVEDKMNVVNLGSLADAIERLADRDINLNINGRKFAEATASDSDRVSGLRSSFLNRGLALE